MWDGIFRYLGEVLPLPWADLKSAGRSYPCPSLDRPVLTECRWTLPLSVGPLGWYNAPFNCRKARRPSESGWATPLEAEITAMVETFPSSLLVRWVVEHIWAKLHNILWVHWGLFFLKAFSLWLWMFTQRYTQQGHSHKIDADFGVNFHSAAFLRVEKEMFHQSLESICMCDRGIRRRAWERVLTHVMMWSDLKAFAEGC